MSIKYEIEKEKLKEIQQARKNTQNKKEDKRLEVIELRILGYTNEEIVEIVQIHIRTITKWIKIYLENGVKGLKNKPRIGNNRNLTFEQEEELLNKFEELANKGQIITVQEIKQEYIKMVGHSIGNGQIYYVLKRHGYRKIMPRSKHPKKASEEVIETSKKLNQ